MLPLVQHNLRRQDHRCYATYCHDDCHSNEELETKEETFEPELGGWGEGGQLRLLLSQTPVDPGRCGEEDDGVEEGGATSDAYEQPLVQYRARQLRKQWYAIYK